MLFKQAILSIATLCATLIPLPAGALTPLRTPDQLAQDELLFAAASKTITPKVMQCFSTSSAGSLTPFKVRFFLANAGQKATQFEILRGDEPPRKAVSVGELAAIEAITRCAPYTVPKALRSWGGFWATVTF